LQNLLVLLSLNHMQNIYINIIEIFLGTSLGGDKRHLVGTATESPNGHGPVYQLSSGKTRLFTLAAIMSM